MQHGVSGAEKIDKGGKKVEVSDLDEDGLEQYAKDVQENYKGKGIEISAKGVEALAKNMYRKADFTH